MAKSRDLIVAPLCEAALLLVAGGAGFLLHKPLLFASLGPTAYEMIETPERDTARPWSVLGGHSIAILAAFCALGLTGANAAPAVSQAGVPLARVAAAVVAVALTVFLTLLLKASQPAALSTTLLLSLGIMQGRRSGVEIFAAVVLITALGEPIRRWRERHGPHKQQQAPQPPPR